MDVASRPALSLYSAQEMGVARYVNAPRGRMILAYGTGCGKTPTAIRAIVERHVRVCESTVQPVGVPNILVVCPAIVRRHWCREFMRWARIEALPIEMGRRRTTGTKAAKQLRDAAYAARVQVVSYDLLPEVKAEGWHYIVLDEIHHLGCATSKQSRIASSLLAANPDAGVLGLSATLIPTDIRQLWHPLYLMFGPHKWGSPNRRGGLSWQFAEKYCGIVRNDYGAAPGSGKPEALPELRERVARVAHRVTRNDILPELPPLNVRMLDVPGQKTNLLEAAGDWEAQLGSDVKKMVILTYHRSLAQSVAKRFFEHGSPMAIFHIDGAMPTTKRDEILSRCEASDRCLLVATTESIREGVRLMWAEHVLLLEWRQSPAQVIQILGRFQSVGDPRKPQLDILSDESLQTEASRLIERVSVVNKVLTAGDAEHKVAEVFAPRELTEDRISQLTLELFADVDRTEHRAAFAMESEHIDE